MKWNKRRRKRNEYEGSVVTPAETAEIAETDTGRFARVAVHGVTRPDHGDARRLHRPASIVVKKITYRKHRDKKKTTESIERVNQQSTHKKKTKPQRDQLREPVLLCFCAFECYCYVGALGI